MEGMPFVEFFCHIQFKVKRANFCTVHCALHVSLLPRPSARGEHKTKPTQASVSELRGHGLSPDIIFRRSGKAVDEAVKDKISNLCHIKPSRVINFQDFSSIYHVPIEIHRQGVVKRRLRWWTLSSIMRPGKHCARWSSCSWWLWGERNPGEDGSSQVVLDWTTGKPFLGVFLGLLLASIDEFARNVLHWADAHSTEVNSETTHPVVIDMAENTEVRLGRNGVRTVLGSVYCAVQGSLGGTMRLGKRRTVSKTADSVLRQMYGNTDTIEER